MLGYCGLFYLYMCFIVRSVHQENRNGMKRPNVLWLVAKNNVVPSLLLLLMMPVVANSDCDCSADINGDWKIP